ncbi:plastocyanin [Povalibacter uvarum]|uniref:Plastocyanin n=1 Tax=Povalibacter uvarum TaxID=732238 RepID=A0A841HPB7_9GAMM|nr:methylamine utilization protein [Povalibacter uvarum]MBB6093775.1 plastocyanin [Povalibacter uvarum]
MSTHSLHLVVAATTLVVSAIAGASNVNTTIVDDKGKPVADAIVYFMPGQTIAPASGKHVIIDQVDKEFVPRVTVVQTGTAIDFPNNDNIRHQVYSFSPAKTFQLKLYSGKPSAPVMFDKSGVAVLGCNIHDHMIAWVLAVDTPYFVRTDAQGRAKLGNLPDGTYEMVVWHPGMQQPLSQGRIDSSGSGTIDRSVTVALGSLLGAATISGETASHAGHDHPGL